MKKILLLSIAFFAMIIINAQPTAGLTSYWPMNGSFTDMGPNAIATNNFGSTAATNKGLVANAAMGFNNPTSTVNQYATHAISSAMNYSGSQDFSISFSLFVASPFLHPGGLYDNNLNYGGYGIWLWNTYGYLQINFNYKNGNIGSTNGALTTDTWYHICCLRSAGTLKIYINGVLNASGPEGTTAPVYNYASRFGSMFYNTFTPPQYNGHTGKMDEFRGYNRALTLAEIQALSAIALPVKLSAFSVNNFNNSNILSWQTAYEQNSAYYTIQRSTDGVNFTDIARVQAAGNASSLTNYSYKDILPALLVTEKSCFYRLQSFDTDGKFDYSNILVIKNNIPQFSMELFPNPASKTLQLQLPSKQKESVNLFIADAAGKIVYSKQLQLSNGNNATSIPVLHLPNGMYLISLENKEGKQTKTFVKQ